MPNLPISQLPHVTSTKPGDLIPVVQDNTTSYINFSEFTATLATTGSNTFNGNQVVNGSLQATAGFTGSLFGTSSWAISSSFSDRTLQIDVLALNQTGNVINKGVVVRITGSNNSSDIPRIVTASYETDMRSANTLGITTQDVANGELCLVITEGILTGVNTQNFISGQLVYLGPTGSIIGTAPIAPLHNVRLGEVIRHQSNNGSIYVRIDNGYEIGELHDVIDTTTTASYGDIFVKSGSVWTNGKQLTGSYGVTGSVSITNLITLNPQHPLPSGVAAGSFAVSSSTPPRPYFYDGTSWNILF